MGDVGDVLERLDRNDFRLSSGEDEIFSYLSPAPKDLSGQVAHGGALGEDTSGSGDSDSDAASGLLHSVKECYTPSTCSQSRGQDTGSIRSISPCCWLFSTLLLSSKGKFHADSSAILYVSR